MALTLFATWKVWFPLLAIFLDLFIGDPRILPHPVQYIGKFLDFLSSRIFLMRKKKFAGAIAVVVAILCTDTIVAMTIFLPSFLGIIFILYWCFSGLALGSLLSEGAGALSEIETKGVDAGRKAVGMLVSRDTSTLTKSELYKTLAETLSENMNDGVIAPFFWLVIGLFISHPFWRAGVLLLWGYKTVSTMDSMWGYKNERWKDIGFACAKIDDILAFIPARLTALFLFCEMVILQKKVANNRYALELWPGWKVVNEQARKMESPNAGLPMATAAWIAYLPMGGVATYHGIIKNKPLLGPNEGQWDAKSIASLLLSLRNASIGGMLCLWAVLQFMLYIAE